MLSYRTVLILMLLLCNQYGVIVTDTCEGTTGSMAEVISSKEDILQTEAVELLGNKFHIADITIPQEDSAWNEIKILTEQEALDRVKAKYATNFKKVIREDRLSFYYKLDFADYYLVSEGLESDRYYLIHLYEFVVDEEATGIGHTVTYGWYAVDRRTGEIEERMVY